jgi:hypothetical protein
MHAFLIFPMPSVFLHFLRLFDFIVMILFRNGYKILSRIGVCMTNNNGFWT